MPPHGGWVPSGPGEAGREQRSRGRIPPLDWPLGWDTVFSRLRTQTRPGARALGSRGSAASSGRSWDLSRWEPIPDNKSLSSCPSGYVSLENSD